MRTFFIGPVTVEWKRRRVMAGGSIMSFSVEATYENGFLKLAKPVPLDEHEKVRVTIEPERGWAERTAGMLQWTGDFEDLRRIAEDDEFGIREAR